MTSILFNKLLRNVQNSSKLLRNLENSRFGPNCGYRSQSTSSRRWMQTFAVESTAGSGAGQSQSTLSPTSSNSADNNVNKQGLELSDTCVKRIKEIASKDKPYLRVSVEGGGCSGFQYKFSFDGELNSDDKVFEKNGAKLIIDETSLDFLKGSVVEYHEELIRSAFRISSNPKADHGCSCGSSFSVKID